MNLGQNISEGLRAVQSNLLRSILTALIIAIGISSLVGILTAIDGIKASISDSFSNLGVNSFEIRSKSQSRGRRQGIKEKVYPIITYKQAQRFKSLYKVPANVSVSTWVTGIAEAKRKSKKTNPNVGVVGDGRPVRGRVVSTWLGGRCIFRDGEVTAQPGAGRFVRPS